MGPEDIPLFVLKGDRAWYRCGTYRTGTAIYCAVGGCADTDAGWGGMAKGHSRYVQSWKSGHSSDGSCSDHDGDDGCSAACVGQGTEFGDHARADLLCASGHA